MSFSGHSFVQNNGLSPTNCWSIRIPVSDKDYVDLTRAFGEKSNPSVVGPFADIIKRTLAPKLSASGSVAPLYQAAVPAPPSNSPRPPSCVFINQFFWPDSAATSQLLTDVVLQALREGSNARVICAANRYAGEESAPPRSVVIHRCPAVPFVRGMLGRFVSYVSFLATSAVHGLRGPSPDTVVTLTTPPGLGAVGTLLQVLRGARHFIWQMDMYPDVAVDVKVLHRSMITRLIGWVFDISRRRADGIIALGEEMKDRLIAHGVSPEKIHVCHNWADGNEIVPLPFPEGPLTIHYSGNFGMAHEAVTVRESVKALANDDRFRFVFTGGGKHHDALELLCRASEIANVSFEPYCPREHLGFSLAQGHLGLVTQLPETLGSVVPSKTYGIMAAGRPILYVGPRQATPARIIEEFHCGWQIEPGDVSGLTNLLETLDRRRDLIAEAGARARRAFEEHFDRPIAVARICKVLGIQTAEVAKPAALTMHA